MKIKQILVGAAKQKENMPKHLVKFEVQLNSSLSIIFLSIYTDKFIPKHCFKGLRELRLAAKRSSRADFGVK